MVIQLPPAVQNGSWWIVLHCWCSRTILHSESVPLKCWSVEILIQIRQIRFQNTISPTWSCSKIGLSCSKPFRFFPTAPYVSRVERFALRMVWGVKSSAPPGDLFKSAQLRTFFWKRFHMSRLYSIYDEMFPSGPHYIRGRLQGAVRLEQKM